MIVGSIQAKTSFIFRAAGSFSSDEISSWVNSSVATGNLNCFFLHCHGAASYHHVCFNLWKAAIPKHMKYFRLSSVNEAVRRLFVFEQFQGPRNGSEHLEDN